MLHALALALMFAAVDFWLVSVWKSVENSRWLLFFLRIFRICFFDRVEFKLAPNRRMKTLHARAKQKGTRYSAQSFFE